MQPPPRPEAPDIGAAVSESRSGWVRAAAKTAEPSSLWFGPETNGSVAAFVVQLLHVFVVVKFSLCRYRVRLASPSTASCEKPERRPIYREAPIQAGSLPRTGSRSSPWRMEAVEPNR